MMIEVGIYFLAIMFHNANSYGIARNQVISDGWIPITRQEAVDKLNPIDFLQYTEKGSSNNLETHKTADNFVRDVIEIIEPQKIIEIIPDEFYDKSDIESDLNPKKTGHTKTLYPNIDDKHDAETNFNENIISKVPKVETHQNNLRTAKLIDNMEIKENRELLFKKEKEVADGTTSKITRSLMITDNVHEVPDLGKTEPIKLIDDSGYSNKFLVNNASPERNPKSILSNILLKYGIRSGDSLENYSRSRSLKHHNFIKPVYVPRLEASDKFRNLIPPDPLLAVFLSNYGCYVPGFYGINSDYRNLYGNLAFNNIHNNKPFGNYKLYSHT